MRLGTVSMQTYKVGCREIDLFRPPRGSLSLSLSSAQKRPQTGKTDLVRQKTEDTITPVAIVSKLDCPLSFNFSCRTVVCHTLIDLSPY